MAPRQQVPGFGDWEEGNIQYTEVFDKAREGRRPNAERNARNPNDPQQNPYAALGSRSEKRRSKELLHRGDLEMDGKDPQAFRQPQVKHRLGYASTVDSGAGDRNSSDRSHTHQTPQRQRGHNRASSNGSSYSMNSTPPHQQAARAGAQPRHHESKTASVPQFGSWNGVDASSNEGYTAIFSRVKEERHGGSPMQQQKHMPSYESKQYDDYNEKKKKTPTASSKFKMCFCFGA